MTVKQFIVLIIPPLLTFLFFFIRQPQTAANAKAKNLSNC